MDGWTKQFIGFAKKKAAASSTRNFAAAFLLRRSRGSRVLQRQLDFRLAF